MPTVNKKAIIWLIVVILILTILELPAPIGFETRPQTHVSLVWLVFFLIILITEITTIPLILKNNKLGAKFGLAATAFNIIQVIADQTHLMQPEIAPLGYSMLEYGVVAASLTLAYFSWKALKNIAK